MAMTSSTWSFEAGGRLIGCGIDAERVERFAKMARAGEDPLPMVFTTREVEHARSTASPAVSLAASFCCKEAVLKAIGEPYELTDCEIFWNLEEEEDQIALGEALRSLYGISSALGVIRHAADQGEISVAAYLFG